MSQSPNTFSDMNSPYGTSSVQAEVVPPHLARLKAGTKTFAIVLLVLGGISVITSIVAPIILLAAQGIAEMAAEGSSEADEELQSMMESMQVIYNPVYIASLVASFITGIGLVVGGIGTLRRKKSGLQILRWTAALMVPVSLFQTAAGAYVQWLNKDMTMKSFENSANRPGAPEMPPAMESFGEMMVLMQIMMAIAFGLVFTALYLWAFLHLSRRSTLEQFETPEGAASHLGQPAHF